MDKERDGKKGTETIFKNDFIAFNNEDLVLDELIDKNYIHAFIALPCSFIQFYGDNFKTVEPLQIIGNILQHEHPLINNYYNQVLNGNAISSGFSFCLQSKLLEDFYNWIIDVLDKFYSAYKGKLKDGEIHRLLDLLFTSYFITYSNVNRGSIYTTNSRVVRIQPETRTKQKISEAKPEDNGIDIHEKENKV